MKICSYSPLASFYIGGGEIYSLNQAESLSNLGYDTHLVVLKVEQDTPSFKKYVQKNPKITLHYIESPLDGISKEDMTSHDTIYRLYYSLSRNFEKLCISERFNCVISHYTISTFSIPQPIKNILLLHGVPGQADLVNKVAVRLPEQLLAVSQSVADGWKSLCGQDLDIGLMHNAVDPSTYFPRPTKEDIDIFFVGRLIEIKGVQHLIKALSLIRSKEPNLVKKVVIGGKGPYLDFLKKLTNELKMEDTISFIGFVNDEDLNSYYNRSKICVFPSYAKEGVLTTMLEAASAARCVLTANCCGMVDFLKNEVNGLLFQPEDSTDLARVIKKAMEDKDLRDKLGQKARQDILSYWTWDQAAKRMSPYIEKHL